MSVDRDGLRRARADAAEWRRRLRELRTPRDARESRELRVSAAATPAPARDARPADTPDLDATGLLLALAYPDRIAQRRPGKQPRYLLRNGSGAVLAEGDAMAESPWLVVAELDGRPPESRIRLAATVDLDELLVQIGDQVVREEELALDDATRTVRAVARERLGAIVLRESPVRSPDPARVAHALRDAVRRLGLDALPWTDEARRVRERLAFLHALDASWPDVSDHALRETMDEWLTPHLGDARALADGSRLDLARLLLDRLPWDRRAQLDELAPTHVTVPTGSRIPVDYADPAAPVLAVRLQELFGLADTPRIARGAVPLVLHLLSPAHRPVQVTRDLAGFWKHSYFDVRRDLRGRYPRHHWPDDPLAAEPTRRAKPRG